jgi:hypothetical protein
MPGIVIDRLSRRDHLRIFAKGVTGVQVPVDMGNRLELILTLILCPFLKTWLVDMESIAKR